MGNADRRLDELNAILHQMAVDHDALTLGEFDGFVAGLLVCPELIPPSEWLPVVFGGCLPKFADTIVAQRTIDAVMTNYNDVARGLARPQPTYEPILALDPNGKDVLWEPWVEGFERAMRLRPDSWLAMVEGDDEEVRAVIPFIIELHNVYHGLSDLDEQAIDRLDEIAPDMIPSMVLTLNHWTKDCNAMSQSDDPVRRTKVGRNEACPCGSGKKYKRCCGGGTLH